MNTRLIVVDGHSSTGKSSISKTVYQQISLHHEAYWLHEECENHPIRQGEFSFGRLDTKEGMEQNRAGMLQKWAAFRDSILASGKVCITEGCLLHAYDRYFIHSIWDEEEIDTYYSQVIEVIKDLDPLIVFLHRPDLRSSLEKAFIARGKWWKDLILKRDDLHVYFKDHVYLNDDSMFSAICYEQTRMMEIFGKLACLKTSVDTTGEDWNRYAGQILSVLGMDYTAVDPHPFNPERYTGMYRWQKGTEDDNWVIQYDEPSRSLYASIFWPYMPMRCMAEDVFELVSFPVEMHFVQKNGRLQFTVRGNYDWEYNDQVFIRV